MNNDVQYSSKNRHVQFSNIINIKFIDDEDKDCQVTADDAVVFSIDVTDTDNVFYNHQLLLDTCAGESVFKSRDLFYDIQSTTTPLVVNGVNIKGEPMVIRESGNTDFGVVFFDPNCIAIYGK